MQGAVSAGPLAVGSQFVGTMENCSRLPDRIQAAADPQAEALEIARLHKAQKTALPGFGHHLHGARRVQGRCRLRRPGLEHRAQTRWPRCFSADSLEDARAAHDRQVPMGRRGTAWDVAHACAFLLPDAASDVSGIELVVDGGTTGKYV